MVLRTRAAIAAGSPTSVAAGAQVAEAGGNVVDIAVATALAATVSELLMCSLGGSGFIMLRPGPGQSPELIDGYDAMPGLDRPVGKPVHNGRRVHLAYGDGVDVIAGHGSIAVPGLLAGLETAWRRHGSLPWAEVIAPASKVAREGCPMSQPGARWLVVAGDGIFGHQAASRETFYPKDDRVIREGERLLIPHLGDTMDAISREGARVFYEGDLAAMFSSEMAEHGGLVTRDDLANYRARVREPLFLDSGGFRVALNPPPAVGGAAVGSLIALVQHGWVHAGSEAERIALLARAQTQLITLRERTLLQPNLARETAEGLMEPDYLRQHLGKLSSPHTTHLSVATADGGLAAITMSMGYGSGITIPGTGIACNNSLGEPELNPHGFHAGKPGTRLVSNMAPTVAFHPDGRAMALGSPGASRITTAIAQAWCRASLGGLSPAEAVAFPRIHVEQWGEELRLQCEPMIATAKVEQDYRIRPFEDLDMFFGAVQIAARSTDGSLVAAADSRRAGCTRLID